MGLIRWPSYFASGGTEGVEFIQCVDGQEPQIHKMWCLSSDSITPEVHPTARISVGAETVGQFSTQYFSENRRRIPVIVQISINRGVQILGNPADAWGCGLLFIDNVQAPTVPHGWGEDVTSNQNCPFILGGPYINVAVAWGSIIPDRPAYTPR